jgi:hypothetical protein
MIHPARQTLAEVPLADLFSVPMGKAGHVTRTLPNENQKPCQGGAS